MVYTIHISGYKSQCMLFALLYTKFGIKQALIPHSICGVHCDKEKRNDESAIILWSFYTVDTIYFAFLWGAILIWFVTPSLNRSGWCGLPCIWNSDTPSPTSDTWPFKHKECIIFICCKMCHLILVTINVGIFNNVSNLLMYVQLLHQNIDEH